VGLGRNDQWSRLIQGWIGASPDGPMNSNKDHNSDPTFPREGSMHQNQARMSLLNYMKIDTVGSLSFRRTLLSYPHVLSHGRIYKA
jgi:hypothetical protein